MTSVQLLDKTEVWIRGIDLMGVDLPAAASALATVLGLPADKVFVTDVRDGLMVLDILSPRVDLERVAGKQAELLGALARLPGVMLAPDASIHSEGILGVIGTPRTKVKSYLAGARKLEQQISDYASRRVAVVSTGAELVAGEVKDTNFEAVREALEALGYFVVAGGVVGDSEREIAGLVTRLSGEGFGIIITTGGVGAEAKDRTIEALEMLDPEIATAVLARYTVGHGRHVKDCVRIAIARIGWSTVFALPGPTHEVKLALPVIAAGLADDTARELLVERIAEPLRATLPWHHGHQSVVKSTPGAKGT
jgi:molybdenum cofactor synthesis domain-containing protein